MENSSFDEQIFGEFAGPISPLGAKQLGQGGHSIQVMLGMNSSNGNEMCNQRLPEVQSLLPGSPKLSHYKNLEYINNKVDYNGKMTSYSPPPNYMNGKLDQYSPNSNKMDYAKPMEYNSNNVKMEYANNSKIDYEQHMQMYQQPSQSMDSPTMGDKKKGEDSHSMGGSTTPTTISDATSTSKKNEKKKGDVNGVKKKKTR